MPDRPHEGWMPGYDESWERIFGDHHEPNRPSADNPGRADMRFRVGVDRVELVEVDAVKPPDGLTTFRYDTDRYLECQNAHRDWLDDL